MQNFQIEQIIHKEIRPDNILHLNIEINEINHQIDRLQLTLKSDNNLSFSTMGIIMEGIQNLIMEDGYGDLTEFQISWTTYHEEDNDDNLYEMLTITFNIDS